MDLQDEMSCSLKTSVESEGESGGDFRHTLMCAERLEAIG